jgi:hypothetical protein
MRKGDFRMDVCLNSNKNKSDNAGSANPLLIRLLMDQADVDYCD